MVQGAVGKRLRYEDLIGPTDSRLSSGSRVAIKGCKRWHPHFSYGTVQVSYLQWGGHKENIAKLPGLRKQNDYLMDGKGRYTGNIFLERLWRTVK